MRQHADHECLPAASVEMKDNFNALNAECRREYSSASTRRQLLRTEHQLPVFPPEVRGQGFVVLPLVNRPRSHGSDGESFFHVRYFNRLGAASPYLAACA
jgi:hypothetical protein